MGQFPTISAIHTNLDGTAVSEEIILPQVEGQSSSNPSLAVDATEVHLTYLESNQVKSTRLNKSPFNIKPFGTQVKEFAVGPFGAVTWLENGSLFFRTDGMMSAKDRKGERKESQPLLIARGGILSPKIAWSGEYFAIVWSQSAPGGRKIMMQRVTNRGLKFGNIVEVSRATGKSNNPVVIFDGSNFVVAWTNETSSDDEFADKYRVFLAMIKDKGATPTFTRQLDFSGSAEVVSLASTGSEYALAWVGSKPEAGSAIFFQQFDKMGKEKGEIIKVTDDEPVAVSKPSLIWGGDRYAVVWHDSRFYEGAEIFFASLKCNPQLAEPADDSKSESDETNPETDNQPKDPASELKSAF
jgi:hypothetical protein